MGPRGNCGCRSLHRVEQLSAGDEDDPGAGKGEQPAAEPRIDFHIVTAPLDRAERNGVDHQPRFEARLDGEKPADLAEHRHS